MYTELAKTYISYTKWHICFYHDLEYYYDQINKFETCLEHMKDICDKLYNYTACKITNEQFTEHLLQMQFDLATVESFRSVKTENRRKKRAPFEFVGKIYNMAFGIMHAESARQYDQKINELIDEQGITHELMKEQTILINNTVNLNRQTFENVKQNIQKLEEKVKN